MRLRAIVKGLTRKGYDMIGKLTRKGYVEKDCRKGAVYDNFFEFTTTLLYMKR